MILASPSLKDSIRSSRTGCVLVGWIAIPAYGTYRVERSWICGSRMALVARTAKRTLCGSSIAIKALGT